MTVPRDETLHLPENNEKIIEDPIPEVREESETNSPVIEEVTPEVTKTSEDSPVGAFSSLSLEKYRSRVNVDSNFQYDCEETITQTNVNVDPDSLDNLKGTIVQTHIPLPRPDEGPNFRTSTTGLEQSLSVHSSLRR